MAYQQMQAAAFVPTVTDLTVPFQTLAFPQDWRKPITDVYRTRFPDRPTDKPISVPINRLNAVLQTAIPDLVSVGTSASFDPSIPWLYLAGDMPTPRLNRFINAWLDSLAPDSDQKYQAILDTAQKLDLSRLAWHNTNVDLLAATVSDGGTATPSSHTYRLLPDVLAAKIEQHDPYQHNGPPLQFRQVAGGPRDRSTRLVSWPPLAYEVSRPWYYSAYIDIAVRTVPYSPVPRIYVSVGITRWHTKPVKLRGKRTASVYMLPDGPLVNEAATSPRLAVAKLTRDRSTGTVQWANGSPGGMLDRVSALNRLPAADQLAEKPLPWLPGHGEATAHGRINEGFAVVYANTLGHHGLDAGLMPYERQRLINWIATALAPEFRLEQPWNRVKLGSGLPQRQLRRPASLPKKNESETDEQFAARVETAAQSQQVDHAYNGQLRRSRLGEILPQQTLTVLLLQQNDDDTDQQVATAIEDSLKLAEHRICSYTPGLFAWRAPDLHLNLVSRPLGELGRPLDHNGEPPLRRKQLWAAIDQRRTEVSTMLQELVADHGDPPDAVLLELEGDKAYQPRATDPKFALRIGLADNNLTSQFFRPMDNSAKNPAADFAHRVSSSWADSMRQLGARFIPQHTVPGDQIPDNLNQVAFWITKSRADGKTKTPGTVPIAILIRPGSQTILGKTPSMPKWIPYKDLLIELGRGTTRPGSGRRDQQKRELAQFIRATLFGLRGEPTLAFFVAQNIRYRLPMMTNGAMIKDHIFLGGMNPQPIATHGEQLRVARIATNDSSETPQTWGVAHDERAGLPKGLWIEDHADKESRVFYSTIEKPSSQAKTPVRLSKFSSQVNVKTGQKRLASPDKSAWNPQALEITIAGLQPDDDPTAWAMYIHQQRMPDEYTSGLTLPLIARLAELTDEYSLPTTVKQAEEEVDNDLAASDSPTDADDDAPDAPTDEADDDDNTGP